MADALLLLPFPFVPVAPHSAGRCATWAKNSGYLLVLHGVFLCWWPSQSRALSASGCRARIRCGRFALAAGAMARLGAASCHRPAAFLALSEQSRSHFPH